MKYELLEILACPICKEKLMLTTFLEEEGKICEGILECKKCQRKYPIIDEIPHMLPDEDYSKEIHNMIQKYSKRL